MNHRILHRTDLNSVREILFINKKAKKSLKKHGNKLILSILKYLEKCNKFNLQKDIINLTHK